LIQLEPKHQVATKLLPQLNVQFKTKAEEAKQTAQQARRDAASLEGAEAAADFGKAQGLTRDAESALAKGEFAVATRGFLEARDSFDKVRRGLEAKLEEKLKTDRAAAQKAAEDSKRQMTAARGAVEKLEGAQSNQEFVKAQTHVKEAEAQEGKGDFATAARSYMDARDYFGRAKTSIENRLADARTAAERKAALDKAAADKAVADKLAADRAAADKAAADKAAADKAAADKAATTVTSTLRLHRPSATARPSAGCQGARLTRPTCAARRRTRTRAARKRPKSPASSNWRSSRPRSPSASPSRSRSFVNTHGLADRGS
jgi:chemotaxis protein histidine kinase CheA